MTSPVEVWNEWSWRHEFTFLPPDILMLRCGAPAEQVRWGSPVHSHHLLRTRGHWPSWATDTQTGAPAPIHAAQEQKLGKDHRKSDYGNKRKFLHEPMGIPQSVFHSPWNSPSSCLIKWHVVSIFSWLFSSLHHWEQSNLSNWCREFFPVWLKQQILYWDSFMAVVSISFTNHGKGTSFCVYSFTELTDLQP